MILICEEKIKPGVLDAGDYLATHTWSSPYIPTFRVEDESGRRVEPSRVLDAETAGSTNKIIRLYEAEGEPPLVVLHEDSPAHVSARILLLSPEEASSYF